jgi:hypothetical protein
MYDSTTFSRPRQRVGNSVRRAKNYQWYKDNADWCIGQSRFAAFTESNGTPSNNNAGYSDDLLMYRMYNNKFPMNLFDHVTDPLSAVNPNHKKFPSKIRPVNMLRTNIDLLYSEYRRKPFFFNIYNMGETGYNQFLEELDEGIKQNLTQHFIQIAWEAAQAQGQDIGIDNPPQPELPEDYASKFKQGYKDLVASNGKEWMDQEIATQHIRQEQFKMYKDWLIVGKSYSGKGVRRSQFWYKKVSPLNIDYDKSPDQDYVEDGDWVSVVYYMTGSDIVDMFYDSELTKKDWETIDGKSLSSPEMFSEHLQGLYTENWGKIPVYHVCFKTLVEMVEVTSVDPENGELTKQFISKDGYTPAEGESYESMWVNEVHETWRIGEDIYTDMGPIPVQRSEMNNFSTCKLPYNGRKFSDTHSDNISPMGLGVPYQIMYMIVTWKLEEMIAKSRGKIIMMDKNAIPKDKGWDEEKFFYYSYALGWGLLNRAQIGVDKSYNQYQVIDMSMYENIEQLISLQKWCVSEWDNLLGITFQRKGGTYASETATSNQASISQSSMITDMITSLFEEFIERDLQGMLDFSKFCNIEGTRRMYNRSDFTMGVLEIDPNKYAMAELGLFAGYSADREAELNTMKQLTQPMLQNAAKPSTVLEVLTSKSSSELMAKLRVIEDIQAQQDQALAQNQEEANVAADARAKEFEGYKSMLKIQEMDEEYKLKENLELTKGDILLTSTGMADTNLNNIPDINEIEKRMHNREENVKNRTFETAKIINENTQKEKDRTLKRQEIASREKIEKEKARVSLKNKVAGEK